MTTDGEGSESKSGDVQDDCEELAIKEAIDYHAVLTKIYQKHNPEKLDDPNFVGNLLMKYADRETLLLATLKQKYKIPGEDCDLYGIGMLPAGGDNSDYVGASVAAAPSATPQRRRSLVTRARSLLTRKPKPGR
jgi:hypothetical protein